MSYNNSAFSDFAFTSSATEIIAAQSNPTFAPPVAVTFTNAFAFVVTPTVAASGGAVTNATALRIDSPSGATNNYSLLISGSAPIGFGGTPTQSYFLVGATVSDTSILNIIQNIGVYQAAASNDPNGISATAAFNPPGATTYGSATGLQIAPTRGGAGTITSLASLIVEQPTGGGSATVTNVCADFQGLSYHDQGITFGVPGVGGYPGQLVDVLQFYVDSEPWTPVVIGQGTTGVGTYTFQSGYYHRIGAMIFIDANVLWTAHTGAGGMRIIDLPFTVRGMPSYDPYGAVNIINIAYGARTAFFEFITNNRIGRFRSSRDNNTNGNVAISAAGQIMISAMYLAD